MAVRVRFPLRVLQKSSLLADSFFVLVRVTQSVGGVSGDLSLLDCCLPVQILVFAKRLCLKTSFHTSFHNHDNLRLQPSRCGCLSTAATVRFLVVIVGSMNFLVFRFPFSVFRLLALRKPAATVRFPIEVD